MVWRSLAERVRRDRALVIGLIGGTVTSFAGVVAYVLVPTLTDPASSLRDVILIGGIQFWGYTPLYHAVVLVLVPFVTTVVAVVAARQRGLSTWRHDLKVVGCIVYGPISTLFVLYLVGAVLVGFTMHNVSADAPLYQLVATIAVVIVLTLLFGAIYPLVVGSVVFAGELVGAGSGYLLARLLSSR